MNVMIRSFALLMALSLLSACATNKAPAPLRGEPAKPEVAGSAESQAYTVKRGDTLNAIAFRFELSVRELARLNNLTNPNTIYVGQVLRLGEGRPVPSRGETPARAAQSTGKKPSASAWKNVKPQPVVVEPKLNTDAATDLNYDDKKQVTKWIWPANGRVVGLFSTGGEGSKGINIAGTQGEPVLAAAEGRVVYSGSGVRGYGQLIIIKHSNEFLSAYAHNSRIYVQENQIVKAGERIADMGSTGTETTQLHFEIRYREKPVDPLKYLPRH
ncbi:MAG: peptidoglycan DD-metalloendopeptidase family protein [Gammaproteobacteria bacterium]|nr:peptidoglycan DD-metalloendopeptidase family protein [Gammaproteobacteria bacterium]